MFVKESMITAAFLFYTCFSPSSAWSQNHCGNELISLPMAWCVIEGTRAATSPNIAGATNTNDLLWNRHERPSDRILIPQALITLRSGILGGGLSFPVIPDPDTTVGKTGDLQRDDGGIEFNAMVDSCRAAYQSLGLGNVGLVAVNANHFVDPAGKRTNTTGLGGCPIYVTGPLQGQCSSPYRGRVVVADNSYLHPSSPNRCLDGGTPPNCKTWLADPDGQTLAHEVGHALTLGHESDAANLMFPNAQDQNVDGLSDNHVVVSAQKNIMRLNACNVVGAATVGQQTEVIDVASFEIFDLQGEFPSLRPDQDIKGVDVFISAHDPHAGGPAQIIRVNLLGNVGDMPGPTIFWVLIDADSDASSGGGDVELAKIGSPPTVLEGVDFAAVVALESDYRLGARRQYVFDGFAFAARDPEDLLELFQVVVTRVSEATSPEIDSSGNVAAQNLPVREPRLVSSSIDFVVPRSVMPTFPGNEQRIQVFSFDPKRGVVDRLEVSSVSPVVPDWPTCSVEAGWHNPGEQVSVSYQGLVPDKPVHILFGPDEVAKGVADGSGAGETLVTIPENARSGTRLVTIGTDGTAYTADCFIRIE